MYNGGEDIGAIILDIGSSSSKIGFAGEDSPRCWVPSSIGVTEDQRKIIGKKELLQHASEIQLKNPLQDGFIHDWDLAEAIIEYACKNSLKVNPSDHPFLIAEPSLHNRSFREKYTELMFEKYDVPAVFFSKTSVLNCFANGRTLGLVVDIGGGITSVAPVQEGFVLQKSVFRSSLAGNILDQSLLKRVNELGISVRGCPEFEKKWINENLVVNEKSTINFHSTCIDFFQQNVIEELKESVCRVSELAFDEQVNAQIPKIPYELPDGTKLELGTERFSVPEMLFSPSTQEQVTSIQNSSPSKLLNNSPNKRTSSSTTTTSSSTTTTSSSSTTTTATTSFLKNNFKRLSLQRLVCDSILSCDLELRRDLFHNIILTGGSSCFENTQSRLEKEISSLAPNLFKTKVIASHPAERKFGAWIGGSILGSLGSFHEMWMSKSEYAEHGATLVEKKCP